MTVDIVITSDQGYSLLGHAGAKVEHGVLQLLLADGSIIVMVKHSESSSHVIHSITTISQKFYGNRDELTPRHQPLPVTVGLEGK